MDNEKYTKNGELIYRKLSQKEIDERFNVDYMTSDLFPPNWLLFSAIGVGFFILLIREFGIDTSSFESLAIAIIFVLSIICYLFGDIFKMFKESLK